MRIKKLLITALLFYATATYASVIDKDHPYFELGQSDDGIVHLWMGGYKEYLPRKTPNGDIIISVEFTQTDSNNFHPKGYQAEYLILANCKSQTAKMLLLWKKPKDGVPGVGVYTNLTGDALSRKIEKDINAAETINIPERSLLEIAVDGACNYLGEKIPQKEKEKEKPREWSASLSSKDGRA